MFYVLFFSIIPYLLGSIPSAVWIGKSMFGVDVRMYGSKNAGATNTFRILGKKAGIFVLIIDISKGFVAAFLPIMIISQEKSDFSIKFQLLAGFFVFLGHLFPIFAQFIGGKGVATLLGIILALHPKAAGFCILIFLIIFMISHYVSLAAIIASTSFPIIIIFIFKEKSIYLILFSILVSILIVLTHKKNIVRILNNNENKMNLFKK
jgi:glycerol-3-phosphate acyltransferase PlsY